MSVPPVPPHRLVGDVGLIDDHNLVVDVVIDAQTRLAAHDTALAGTVPLTQRAATNGVATLDSGTKIPTAQIPDLSSSYVKNGGIVVLASAYGAIGDNTTDNFAALTAALTAIKAATTFAKSVTLHLGGAGVYLTSAPILLDAANLTLSGDGKGTTILKLTTTLASQSTVLVTGNNCAVKDITIDSNGKTAHSLKGDTISSLFTEHVTVTGTTDSGVYFTNVDDSTLRDVTMIGCGTTGNAAGMFSSDCDNLVLDHCHSINNWQHGYYLLAVGGLTLTMTGCTASGNGTSGTNGYGISARYNRATVTGCLSWGNYAGSFNISAAVETPSPIHGSYVTITGNVFGGTTSSTSQEIAVTGDKCIFTGNVITSAVATAAVLRFFSSITPTVTGNFIEYTLSPGAGAGIRFDTCSDILCSSNNIKGPASGFGVYVLAATTGKITNNKMDGFATGVNLSASVSNDVHVTNNQFTNVTTNVVNSSTGTGVVIQGNNLPVVFEFGAPARWASYPTVSRPTASSVGAGSAIWDSTANAPYVSNGSSWAPIAGTSGQGSKDFLLNGSNGFREPFSRFLAGTTLAALTSGVEYMVAVPVYVGDLITSITFLASVGLTMGTNADGNMYCSLRDSAGNLLGQTAAQGGSVVWAAGKKTIALASPYTVATDQVVFVGVMVNFGTGGSPVIPSLRGAPTMSTAAVAAPIITGQARLAGTTGTGLTTTAPAGPLTPATSVFPAYCVLS